MVGQKAIWKIVGVDREAQEYGASASLCIQANQMFGFNARLSQPSADRPIIGIESH